MKQEQLREFRISTNIKLAFQIALLLILISLKSNLQAEDCKEITITDFPQSDLPSKIDRDALKGNKSYKYYYGIGVPIDYVKARQIALMELETGYDDNFGGASILMMIYANGLGVKQDLDLSIKLACGNIKGADMEIHFRKSHLEKMKTGEEKKIDICDDITSGYMDGLCTGLAEEEAEEKQKSETESMINKWPKTYRTAFDNLKKISDDFFDARVENEVDLSGTSRGADQIAEEGNLKSNFSKSFSDFEKGTFPNFSSEDFKNNDKELNSVYKIIMSKSDFDYGSIKQVGIKTVQKKWILYRDAWVKFGSIRYPKVSNTSWKAWLTQDRIKQLKEFIQN